MKKTWSIKGEEVEGLRERLEESVREKFSVPFEGLNVVVLVLVCCCVM